jgi:hypothetical protein
MTMHFELISSLSTTVAIGWSPTHTQGSAMHLFSIILVDDGLIFIRASIRVKFLPYEFVWWYPNEPNLAEMGGFR